MYETTVIFDHTSHARRLDGNRGCVQCHADGSAPKSYENTTVCAECHANLAAPGPVIETPAGRWPDPVGYMEAMHELCIRCHQIKAGENPEMWTVTLERCDTCHDADREIDLRRAIPRRVRDESVGAVAGSAVGDELRRAFATRTGL